MTATALANPANSTSTNCLERYQICSNQNPPVIEAAPTTVFMIMFVAFVVLSVMCLSVLFAVMAVKDIYGVRTWESTKHMFLFTFVTALLGFLTSQKLFFHSVDCGSEFLPCQGRVVFLICLLLFAVFFFFGFDSYGSQSYYNQLRIIKVIFFSL